MRVLRLDAVYCVVLGALLLAGSWDGLYEALDLPVPKPALYAQLAGVLLLVLAYLLWTAREPRLLAGPAAAGNAASAALLAVWLVAGKVSADALGTTLVALVAAGLAGFAVAEARLARR